MHNTRVQSFVICWRSWTNYRSTVTPTSSSTRVDLVWYLAISLRNA